MEPEYGAQAPEEREHTLPPAVLARARDINSRIAETVYGPGHIRPELGFTDPRRAVFKGRNLSCGHGRK